MTDFIPEKRHVVLGITGSIASYKSAEIARILVSRGYEVRVMMTDSAQKFITPTTLQSVTGKPVVTDFWETQDVQSIEHIEISDWADVLVIAPATADVIAKLAVGISDTPLLAAALATRAPILVAPAMNVNMLEHTATQANIETLKKRGVLFVDPEEGALACGWNGAGRLADPWEIFYHIRRALSNHDYKGKRVLISTGPTREYIDPVRFISNRSSGKMGTALAREAFCRGADVTLVHGPVKVDTPDVVRCVPVTTAVEMEEAMLKLAFSEENPFDIVIMAAAVADFRPKEAVDEKIKRSSKTPSIAVTPNPDILAAMGARRKGENKPTLVGFAVETGELEDLISELRSKLQSKGTDLMVGNFAHDAFDLDTNRVWLIDKFGKQEEISTTFKGRVANRILDAILKL